MSFTTTLAPLILIYGNLTVRMKMIKGVFTSIMTAVVKPLGVKRVLIMVGTKCGNTSGTTFLCGSKSAVSMVCAWTL